VADAAVARPQDRTAAPARATSLSMFLNSKKKQRLGNCAERGNHCRSRTLGHRLIGNIGHAALNVLLSSAQFEREVTGERIRDKIAASKSRGMWMGGNLPLGYDRPSDPATRALVVNEGEAEQVRLIFRRYVELGSVSELERWLHGNDIRSKA
ncbi:MAG: resolvase, terminal domain protein, partial [Caulobacteraceae bacterium]|nr:resolvase, terminal domain protein [Caulobacteraceae bacterium]